MLFEYRSHNDMYTAVMHLVPDATCGPIDDGLHVIDCDSPWDTKPPEGA